MENTIKIVPQDIYEHLKSIKNWMSFYGVIYYYFDIVSYSDVRKSKSWNE